MEIKKSKSLILTLSLAAYETKFTISSKLKLVITELIFNYKGNNGLINKISLFLDVISIFVLLFTKQPYVIALMFVIFIIKIIMYLNVNKSVIKNSKCER